MMLSSLAPYGTLKHLLHIFGLRGEREVLPGRGCEVSNIAYYCESLLRLSELVYPVECPGQAWESKEAQQRVPMVTEEAKSVQAARLLKLSTAR